MNSQRIVLVTKTRTQNQGNQALSIAWRDYLSGRYPGASLRLLERAPTYLKRYTTAALAREGDPVSAFDEIATGLLRKSPEMPNTDPSVWNVTHDAAQSQVIRFRRLRQLFRIRSRLAALSLGATPYLKRLSYLASADLVVINPAGEFQQDATDTALHYLIEARCAQMRGCRTAFVNLSFELTNPTVVQISNHVFRSCDILEFRDSESRRHYLDGGGQREPLVLPDGAILSALTRPKQSGGRGLALAINALQVDSHGLEEGWDTLLSTLLRTGPVTLVSNEWTTDHPFWRRYLQRDGVTCDGQFLNYADYADLLSAFDVVVSSRLHTCVLGMLAGAVVVPVETGTFKLTGFFNQIGMLNEPVRMNQPGWQDQLLDRIRVVRDQSELRVATQDRHLAEAKLTLRNGLDRVFTPDILERC